RADVARAAAVVGGRRHRGVSARAAAARGRLVFPPCTQPAWHSGRSGGTFPSRQRGAARAPELARRPLGEGYPPVLWADGELPLRPRRHREEPRGLCDAAHRRCSRRGAPALQRSPERPRAGTGVTTNLLRCAEGFRHTFPYTGTTPP